MSRFIRSAVCAVVLSSACTAPAFAAEPDTMLVISGKSLDCATGYIQALHLEDNMKAMMAGLMPAIMEQNGGDSLSADKKAAVMDSVNESMMAILPKMMGEMGPLLAATLTETEVCALSDFYGSAMGQSIMLKMPEFGRASAEMTGRYMVLMQQEMTTRLCRKIDCGLSADPKKAPAKAS